MPYDAREVANFVLDYADQKRLPLTIMALLKLIYFAHGWYLAKHGTPLVRNRFEAWRGGPVVRIVYEGLKGSGKQPIQKRLTRFDPVSGITYLASPHLREDDAHFVKNIVDVYGPLHAYKLSDITHEPGSPWDLIWNDACGSSHPGMVITNDRIRQHFLTRHHGQAEH